jgi:hypothetical protein
MCQKKHPLPYVVEKFCLRKNPPEMENRKTKIEILLVSSLEGIPV